MHLEKDNIKCESCYNDDYQHRYLCKKIWNKDKPCIAVIMLNAGSSTNIITDATTARVLRNVAQMEIYGGVQILNIYSILTNKLDFRYHSDEELNHPENDKQIVKSAGECEKIVVAWGKAPKMNQRVAERVANVMELLKPFWEKLYVIVDGERRLIHPLHPSISNHWELDPLREEDVFENDPT